MPSLAIPSHPCTQDFYTINSGRQLRADQVHYDAFLYALALDSLGPLGAGGAAGLLGWHGAAAFNMAMAPIRNVLGHINACMPWLATCRCARSLLLLLFLLLLVSKPLRTVACARARACVCSMQHAARPLPTWTPSHAPLASAAPAAAAGGALYPPDVAPRHASAGAYDHARAGPYSEPARGGHVDAQQPANAHPFHSTSHHHYQQQQQQPLLPPGVDAPGEAAPAAHWLHAGPTSQGSASQGWGQQQRSGQQSGFSYSGPPDAQQYQQQQHSGTPWLPRTPAVSRAESSNGVVAGARPGTPPPWQQQGPGSGRQSGSGAGGQWHGASSVVHHAPSRHAGGGPAQHPSLLQWLSRAS